MRIKTAHPYIIYHKNILTKYYFYSSFAPINATICSNIHTRLYRTPNSTNQQKYGTKKNIAVLVLVFVVYNRRRESHIKYPGPDDDVRENIINYDDEGGGEDDMTAFDITPLQIPIGGPMPELSNCKMPIMCKYYNILE